MRIISGKFRGAKLETPKGMETRPTSDRARESLFNLLENGKFKPLLKGHPFADIFAGTGAVGLEALSRGASEAFFVENGPHAFGSLNNNIQKCRCEDHSRIIKANATRLPRAPRSCGLVFIDPPYGKDLITPTITAVIEKEWVMEEGIIITQGHPSDPVEIPSGYEIKDERKYGAALLYFIGKI